MNLSNNRIGPKGTTLLVESLKDSTLQYLNLSHNQIEDTGAYSIAKLLERQAVIMSSQFHLQELKISNN